MSRDFISKIRITRKTNLSRYRGTIPYGFHKSPKLYNKVEKLIDKKRYSKALKISKQLDISYITVCRSWIIKGQVLAKRGERQEASNAYDEVHARAINLFDKQNYQLALEVLNELTKENPEDYKKKYIALTDEGRTLAKLYRNEEAVDAYNKAIDLKPSHTCAHNEKGIAFRELKEYQKSIEVFNSVLGEHPEDFYACINLGLTYYYNEDYDKAIELFERAQKLNNKDPGPYHYKGLVLYSQKKYNQVCSCLDEAIKRYDDRKCRAYAEALYQQSLAYIKLNKKDEAKIKLNDALHLFEEAVIRRDSLYDAYNYKGLVLRELANLEKDKSLRKEAYTKAQDCFEKAIDQPKECAAAYRNKALVLHDLKKYREAIKVLNKAIGIDPRSILSRNNKGVTLYSLRSYTDSLKEFEEVLSINSKDTYSLNYKGLALYSLGRYKEAEETFNKVLDINPNDPDTYNYIGLVFYETGRYSEALTSFKESIEFNPRNISPYNNIILTYASLDYKEEFIRAFDNATKISANNSEAWTIKANYHTQKNEYEEAVKAFDEAFNKVKGVDLRSAALARRDKALALRKFGKKEEEKLAWKEAIKNFIDSFEDETDDIYTLNKIGFAYRKLGQYKKAIKYLDQALSINKRSAEAWNNIGLSYSEIEEYNEALKAFQAAIEIDPNHAEAYANKGITLLHLKDHKEAEESLEKAIDLFNEHKRLNSDNFRALYNIGLILQDLHRHRDALRVFRKVTNSHDNHETNFVWNNIGFSEYHLGNYTESIKAFKKAVEMNPYDGDMHYNLGFVYYTSGYYNDAIDVFEKTLQLGFSDKYLLYYNKGRALLEVNRYKEAEKALKMCIKEVNKAFSEEDKNISDI